MSVMDNNILPRDVWMLNFDTSIAACVPTGNYEKAMNGVVSLIVGAETAVDPLLVILFCIRYGIKPSAGRTLYKFFKKNCTLVSPLINHMEQVTYALGDKLPEHVVKHITQPRDIIMTSKGLAYLASLRQSDVIDDECMTQILAAATLEGSMSVMLGAVKACHVSIRKQVYLKLRDVYLGYDDLYAIQQLLDALI